MVICGRLNNEKFVIFAVTHAAFDRHVLSLQNSFRTYGLILLKEAFNWYCFKPYGNGNVHDL